MPECKLSKNCILFSKVDFLNLQKILNSSKQDFKSCCKQIYCDNNFKQCARYQVVKALGRERVPDLLLPPQNEIANQLIEKTDKQKSKTDKEKYQKIFESAPMGIMIEDKAGTILEANEALCEITGYNKEELEGSKIFDTLVPSGLEKKATKNISQVMAGENLEVVVKSDTKAGNKSYTKICEKKVTLSDYGEVILSMQTDLTRRKELEAELKEIKNRLELAIEVANLGLWDWNNQTGEVKFNENWAAMLGYKLEEIDHNFAAWRKRIHEEDKKRVLEKLSQHLKGNTAYYESEHRLRTKNNNWKWIKDIGKVVNRDENGIPVRAVGIHLDIDDRKRAEQRAEYLSFHDELTGLYNRRYFENEKNRLNNSRQLPISIIVGDMDELKAINDNYGHKRGDEYIKQAAYVFEFITREEDLVARIGGDEFAVLLPEADAEAAEKVCNRFYKKLKEVNSNQQFPKKLSISLGFATMTSNSQDLDKVLELADQNMYKSKKSKR